MLRQAVGTCGALVVLGLSYCGFAAPPAKPAFLDPATAGPDFQIQGEYLGEVQTNEGLRQYGAQVIALGQGQFRAVGYPGGLPGEGWQRGDEKSEVEGRLENGEVNFYVEGAVAKLKDGAITVLLDGRTLGTLKKVERKSPTLGARPPAGAIVLFDGSTAETFENGKLVEGNLLAASGCTSRHKLGDHQLHVEFRTPFMPEARGQGRGNSGVYVQSRYEVQVLDSFGLEGEDNECGGIYKYGKPRVNMCFPPLSWQTFDIDFTAARYNQQGQKISNARITVRHNGVVIHDNLELKDATPGRAAEGPEKAGVFLQDHRNPVVFRNLWAVEK